VSNVDDVDRGLERVFSVSKKMQREIASGIFVRKILDYAFIVNARFEFLQKGTARAEPEVSKKLDELHDLIASGKGNIRAAQKAIGEVIAEGIRAEIKEQNLIKTGNMLRAVTVKERQIK
jgi:hypothetical protein